MNWIVYLLIWVLCGSLIPFWLICKELNEGKSFTVYELKLTLACICIGPITLLICVSELIRELIIFLKKKTNFNISDKWHEIDSIVLIHSKNKNNIKR